MMKINNFICKNWFFTYLFGQLQYYWPCPNHLWKFVPKRRANFKLQNEALIATFC